MEDQRGYKWEPHICKKSSRKAEPGPPTVKQIRLTERQTETADEKDEKPEKQQPEEEHSTRSLEQPTPPPSQPIIQSPSSQPLNTQEAAQTTTIGQLKKLYDVVDTWVDVWKLVAFTLLCAGRYFLVPTSYDPLAAFSTTMAHLVTISHWLMMGAYLLSSIRHKCCTGPAGSVKGSLVDKAQPELEDRTVEEIGGEVVEASSEETEAYAETMEVPKKEIQEELAIVMGILAHGIKLKNPQSRSSLEQLLVKHWDALQ